MPDMDRAWQKAIEPLEALRNEVPSTKTGFVRRALPQIEEALAGGHSLKVIWQRFREAGFDIQYKHFCTYVGRVRGEREKREPAPKVETGKSSSTTISEPLPMETPRRDPFANLRRVEAERERTVFDYRGTQDLEELVYGTKGRHYKKQ
jgi:hypothetical protein